jgi:hypothetical protein
MRTTILLNDGLFREAKQLAARTGRSFTALVEEALRETLARAKARPQPGKIRLKTSAGAFREGVNLDKSSELADLMDELDARS